MDRLNKVTSAGIFSIEHAWGEMNPLRKDIDYTKCIVHMGKGVKSEVWKHYVNKFQILGIFIPSKHSGTLPLSIELGDTIFLGQDLIIIKSGKKDSILKKHYVNRISLLSRSPYTENVLKIFDKHERLAEANNAYTDEYFRTQEEEYMKEFEEDIL